MKKMIVLLLIGCLSMMTGCSGVNEDQSEKETINETNNNASDIELPVSTEKHKIIIDTDAGADDSAAIILAASSENLEILGVTTLAGNVDLEQSTKNVLAALEVAGCDAPVYEGAENTYDGRQIEAFSVFGSDGMGDAGLIHPSGKTEKEDAVSFIINTIKENPGEVEIVSIGPATNIANAIEKDPETMKDVKRIWSMGSTGLGPGNASPVAEFNVYHDAEAYKIMLDFEVPITVVGLDVCDGDALWTDVQFEKLKKSGEIGSFITDSFVKLREFYVQNGFGNSVMNCDPVTIMCLVYPEFFKESIPVHGSCITTEGECYGQVIYYWKGFTYDVVKNDFNYNVSLVSKVDKNNYFNYFLKTIQSKDVSSKEK